MEPPQASSNCSICLQPMENRSVISSCFHEFCLECIRTWARYELSREAKKRRQNPRNYTAERKTPGCPLCKTHFKFVMHSIKSESQFKTQEFCRNTDDAWASSSSSSIAPEFVPYRRSIAGQELIRETRRQSQSSSGIERSRVVGASTQRQRPLVARPSRSTSIIEHTLQLERRRSFYSYVRKHSSRLSTAELRAQSVRQFNFAVDPRMLPKVKTWIGCELEAALGREPDTGLPVRVIEAIREYELKGRSTDVLSVVRTLVGVGDAIAKAFLGELEEKLRSIRPQHLSHDQKQTEQSTSRMLKRKPEEKIEFKIERRRMRRCDNRSHAI
ncbi:hypothetical protein AAMO2058_000368500 [Amorphochlora amoebiformis]